MLPADFFSKSADKSEIFSIFSVKTLYVHWETDEGFMHRHLTNRANRVSVRSSIYTGGSVTFTNTKAKLSLDRDATLAKTFKHTHTLKENKERFTDHYRLETETQQSQQSGEDASDSAVSVIDPNAVWRETTSPLYKNRNYGLGLFFTSSLHSSTFASATNQNVDPEEGINLRLQVQELTWSLHEQPQELNETRERYQKILTRVMDMDELRLEWWEQVERLQRMEQ
ncbi:hypothetical protein Ahy_A03g014232 [Arachis hypogaea]|uniref:Uncharacterized protein n=1 Tax=Arachis hypogaea TaxID=3818 RepID=A0A445DXG9_ARAHY|nr:hypothetical protein Ahy_A03g014232 [Arachis hypogaea]